MMRLLFGLANAVRLSKCAAHNSFHNVNSVIPLLGIGWANNELESVRLYSVDVAKRLSINTQFKNKVVFDGYDDS